MPFASWIKRLPWVVVRNSKRTPNSVRKGEMHRRRFTPQLEQLESRLTPAGPFIVTNTTDTGGSNDGSLRGEILAAQTAGPGNIVSFKPGLNGTISLTKGNLSLTTNITIDGTGADITVSGAKLSGITKGGVFIVNGATTDIISGLTITGGSATLRGGGIYNGGTLTLTNDTLSGNSATFGGGGGIFNTGGTLTLTNDTLSGNSAGVGGGGIWNTGGNLTLTNDTLSGNSAGVGGGIVNVGGTLTLTNDTLSGNSARATGGGIYAGSGTLTVYDTIIAGNTASTGPDFFGAVTTDKGYNLVGSTAGNNFMAGTPNSSHSYVGTGSTTASTYLSPRLGFLQNNGGPTQTMALLPGSPAFGLGNPAAPAPLTDQRGFARIPRAGKIDSGAFENQSQWFNVAAPGPQTTTALTSTSFALGSFAYSGNAGNLWNVTVNWGDGSAPTSFLTFNQGTIAAQSHTYTTIGSYSVTIYVQDLDGNFGQKTATVNVNGPIVVNTTADTDAKNPFISPLDSSGNVSLLSAIEYANANNFAGTIAFLSGLSGTIALAPTPGNFPGNLQITDSNNLTIDGSRATITVSGSALSGITKGGVFYFTSLTNTASDAIKLLTISGGKATTSPASGGGIYDSAGNLTLTNDTIAGNAASNRGGGIYNHGGLTLTNVTVANNTAGNSGGGVYNDNGGTLTLGNTTIAYNSATTGGGVYNSSTGKVDIVNTIVDANTTGGATPTPNDVINASGGTFISSGGNLYGTSSPNIPWLTKDTTYVDRQSSNPLLDTLQNNGGPTQTIALLPGSLAVGNANPANAPTTDQRAFPRPAGGPTDIGAYQNQSQLFTLMPPPAGQTATVGTSAGINLGSFTYTGTTGSFWTVTVYWGDGTQTVFSTNRQGSLGIQTHTYTGFGVHTLSVAVNDADGDFGQATTTVTVGGAIVVNTLNDAGARDPSLSPLDTNQTLNPGEISLRSALEYAAATKSSGTINFLSGLTGTIDLGSTLDISVGNLTIDGSGANIAISGQNAVQDFAISSGIDLQPVTIKNLSIIDGNNTITGQGGGIYIPGGPLVALNNDTFTGNNAIGGGAIFVASGIQVDISNCTFQGNSASDGGAIYNAGGSVTIGNTTFASNTAGNRGGAIFNFYPGASLQLTNSTFNGNQAANFGGALYNTTSSNLYVNNDTISGNSTGATGHGGGIYNSAGALASVYDSVVAGNSAASSTAGADFYGNAKDAGYNLIGIGGPGSGNNFVAGMPNPSHSYVGTTSTSISPLLGVLQNNGGPTQTFALLPGSPSLASGNITTLATPTGVSASSTSTTNGNLNVGTTYDYVVTAFNGAGETLASSEASVTLTSGNNAVAVSWSPVSGGVDGYKIYGRTAGAEQLIGTVSGATTSFTDTGLVFPAGAPPTSNTTTLTTDQRGFQRVVLLNPPVAPTLSSVSGGSIHATTYYVKITYVTATGETLASTESSIAVGDNSLLVVNSPVAMPGATGYNVYVSTSSGVEKKQNSLSIGTNWQEPTTGLISGSTPPISSTARVTDIGAFQNQSQWFNLIAPSNQTATAGSPASLNLGSFTYTGSAGTPWTVTVGWGDGTQSTFSTTSQGTLPAQSHSYGALGAYTLTITVTDLDNNFAQTSTATVTVGGAITVNTTQDVDGVAPYATPYTAGGLVTLRSALHFFNANNVAGTIAFAPSVNGIITLASALPHIASNMSIQGPGASVLTVSGNNLYQVFHVGAGNTVAISGLTVSDGSSVSGGGIYSSAGSLTLSNDVVTNNTATTNEGGGIYNKGGSILTMINDTVANNTAGDQGGGLFNSSFPTPAEMTLTNVTIANNKAINGGGGILNSGIMTLNNDTLTNNRDGISHSAGGIYTNGTLALYDTIVAGNVGIDVDKVGGTFTSNGFNLYSTSSGIGTGGGSGNWQTTDKQTATPDLGGLQNNGGPTPTVALLPGSLALGNGNYPATLVAPTGVTASSTTVGGPPSGILIPGNTYAYEVTAFNIAGETVASSPASVTIAAGNNAAAVSWSPITGVGVVVAGYKIYGRTAGSEQLIGLVGPATTSFTDLGLATPSGAPPTSTTITTDQRGFQRVVNNKIDIGAYENQSQLFTLALPGTNPSPDAGASAAFNLGSFSYSGSSNPWTVTVNWGDNTTTTFTTTSQGSLGTQNHTYTVPGNPAATITVTVTDANGNFAQQSFNVTVNSAITISPTSLPQGKTGAGISQQITASGGVGPFTYTPTGNLDGLTLQRSGTFAGLLQGTPTAAGTFNFTVTATDSSGASASQSFSFYVIAAPITVTTLGDFKASNASQLPLSTQGNISLRSAIQYASAVGYSGVINFTPGLSGTINLSSAAGFGTLLVNDTGGNLTIDGTGASITVSGQNSVTPFTIGITTTQATVTINNLSIVDGSGIRTGEGGGVFNRGALTLSNDTITGNAAFLGGGIANEAGTLMISNCTITNNSANNAAGVANASGGRLVVANSTIANNTANNLAGGLSNSAGGIVTLTNDNITGNSATSGGGIYNSGGKVGATLTLTNSTVANNTGTAFGGGIYNITAAVTIVNSTIANNKTGNTGAGGGIYNTGVTTPGSRYFASSVTLGNVTIANNSADTCGGLYNAGTVGSLYDTIVDGNTGGDLNNTSGKSFVSKGGNLYGSVNGFIRWVTTGSIYLDIADTQSPENPGLGGLQNNGGPTPTIALLPGSLAIGNGNPASPAPSTDQRGFQRIPNASNKIDIGAFENQSQWFTLTNPSSPQSATAGVSTAVSLGSFAYTGSAGNSWKVDVSWGDGSADTVFTTTSQGSLGTQNHTYTTAGSYNLGITVTDAYGNFAPVTPATAATINVSPKVTISPTSIPATTSGNTYTSLAPFVTFTASGGVAGGYTFSATGNLDGMTLSTGGALYGSPTIAGTFGFTVTATDSHAPTGNKGSQSYVLTVLPGAVQHVLVSSGNGQTGTPGSPLANPLVVEVTDGNGNPIPGVTIDWSVVSGGGSYGGSPTASSTTNSAGLASVAATLGTSAGSNTFKAATTGGIYSTQFTETGSGSVAVARLVAVSGNNQSGNVGAALSNYLVVEAEDSNNNPVANVTVTWAGAIGGGSVTPVSAKTDSNGQASFFATLGNTHGTQTFTFTSGGSSPVTFTATATVWQGTSLGGFVTQISSALDKNGHLELFGIGGDHGLWYNVQTSGSTFTGWTSLGGYVKQITVSTQAGGLLAVFAIGGDNAAYLITQNVGGSWTPGAYTDLGGYVQQLAAGLDKSGHLELFGIGGDNALWYNVQTSGTSFGGWNTLNGYVKQITVGTNFDGTLQVFGIGGDNAAWYRKQHSTGNLTFDSWTSLGGYVTQLATGLDLNHHLELFGIGGDHAIWVNSQTDSTGVNFSGWSSLGGYVTQISVTTDQGDLDVFGIGGDSAIWYRKQNTANNLAFDPYVRVAASIAQLSAVADNSGNAAVFAIGKAFSDGQFFDQV